jgi:hypothetical protein
MICPTTAAPQQGPAKCQTVSERDSGSLGRAEINGRKGKGIGKGLNGNAAKRQKGREPEGTRTERENRIWASYWHVTDEV